jgi:glyoxylase-like metal-dependent hydrolase (beta-lactamase superfamily II)
MRRFAPALKQVALAAAFVAQVAAAQPAVQAQIPAQPAIREVAPGVSLIPGQFTRGVQPDGNSVVLHGNDGTIIIDTGRHVLHTQRVLAAATKSGQAPVAVINTHWHLDHIGGNVLIRQRYPKVAILASGAFADARKGFLADYRAQLAQAVAAMPADKSGGLRTEMALIDAGDKLAPSEVIGAGGDRTIAGRRLTLGLEKNAATEGDVWILDRASGTLMTGDLVTLPVPFLDTANPEGWAAALDRLAKVDAKLVVPGHGEPMPPAGLETYRKAFRGLLACAKSTRASAECSDEWFKAIGDLGRGTDPALAKSALGYYLDNVLRTPKPRGK